MKIRYSITKKCCPVCHTVLETDNSEFWLIVFTPFILVFFILAIPYFIARWILFELVLCVNIPKICKTPLVNCPSCGAKVRISNDPIYNELNKEDKFLYDNRVLLRAAYFFGGTLLYGVLFSFFLTDNDELSKIFGWIGLSLVIICLFIVVAIVYYWKTYKTATHNQNDNQSNKDNKQQNAHGLSPNLNFEINKAKSSSGSSNMQPTAKAENVQEKSLNEKLNLILDYKYFIELEKHVQSSEFDLADNLIKFPYDALDYAIDKCKTTEEIFKTKFDFFIYLVKLDSEIKNDIVTNNGFSYFLDFSCDNIIALFSEIIAYISDNITLKWQKNETEDDGELIASGRASKWFNILDSTLEEKGAFFNNSFNADLITDIWYDFLNDSVISDI